MSPPPGKRDAGKRHRAMPRSVDPNDLLSTSPGHLFQLFRNDVVRTRSQLVRASGLSRFTVALRVEALLRAGYLHAAGVDESTGGRRANLLVPNYEPRTILAADFGATHGRLAVLDATGAVLAESAFESRIDTGPAAVLGRAAVGLGTMLADTGRDPESVCGIGMGFPGPVDVTEARLVQPPIMPGWHDYPIREFMAKHFAAPVFVGNDANLMALGESRLHYPGAGSLVFVKVATGIGAGVVLGDRIWDGVDGGAGDIGHVKVPAAAGVRCSCGAEGCLAAVASGAAVARKLAGEGWPAATSRDVVSLVQDGIPDAVATTRAAGELLGEVLSTVVSLLNPEVLVIGGDMALTHEHFVLGLKEILYRRTPALTTRSLVVARSRLGDQAGVAGISALVTDEVFSARAVDAAIAALPQHVDPPAEEEVPVDA